MNNKWKLGHERLTDSRNRQTTPSNSQHDSRKSPEAGLYDSPPHMAHNGFETRQRHRSHGAVIHPGIDARSGTRTRSRYNQKRSRITKEDGRLLTPLGMSRSRMTRPYLGPNVRFANRSLSAALALPTPAAKSAMIVRQRGRT